MSKITEEQQNMIDQVKASMAVSGMPLDQMIEAIKAHYLEEKQAS